MVGAPTAFSFSCWTLFDPSPIVMSDTSSGFANRCVNIEPRTKPKDSAFCSV